MIEFDIQFEDGRRQVHRCNPPVTLGRLATCQLPIQHWRVARQHVLVSRAADGIHIEDLGSLGGTRVNGRRITRKGPILATDEIIVGPCLIHVRTAQVTQTESGRVDQRCLAGDSSVLAGTLEQDDRLENPLDGEQAIGTAMPGPLKGEAQMLPAQSDATSEIRVVVQAGNGIEPARQQENHYAVRQELHAALLKAFDLRRRDISSCSDEVLRHQARQCVAELLHNDLRITTDANRDEVIRLVIDEAIGLGVLEELLADQQISEIMVNRHDEIFVEKSGRLVLHHASFSSEAAVRGVVERIVFPLGRRIDDACPMVDARLQDGSRINAVIPPVSIHGICLTIRKFPKHRLTMSDLVDKGTLSQAMADFLDLCVKRRLNILVSGGTGSGKTTLLNVLSCSIPTDQRIITIEDSAELQIQHPHVVALEARPENAEGQGRVAIRDLVRNALRMRPDRIVVGEVRGPEAIDMLTAMNTGHEGSLTTLHANSPRDALSRLETMMLMAGLGIPVVAIREQIASALQLVIQQTRLDCGRRLISSVVEITGIESGTIQVQPLMQFDAVSQRFVGCGLRPTFLEAQGCSAAETGQDWFAAQ